MAVLLPTVTPLGGGAVRVKWGPLAAGDTGAPFSGAGRFPDKSVQLLGTTLTTFALQGSNDGGTTWQTLNDANGNPINETGGFRTEQVLENVDSIRPNLAAGTAVTVAMLMR